MSKRIEAFQRYQRDLYLFSRDVIGVPLYPYQSKWAQYLLDLMADGRNETVIIEMSRQSGKNQGQACYQVAALARFGRRDRSIVACAPTYRPQLINSQLRFKALAERVTERMPWLEYKPSQGYIFRCGRAAVQFLSADPSANVVGATASLMLNVDEAQDTSEEVYAKRFSPMRASTNAPVAMFGTTWDTENIFAKSKRAVLEGRARGKVFRVLPEEIALSNPAYGEFVDSEIAQRGRDHPYVRTQYFLEELDTAGRMLTRQQIEAMIGAHPRQERRAGESLICAGLDFAGADEHAGELVSLSDTSARDSVALTVAAVTWLAIGEGILLPRIEIKNRYEWTNVNPVSLHSQLYDILWNRWRVDLAYCDATGIGATGTAMLAAALNKPGRPERIKGVTFDSAWNTHTDAAFGLISAINNGNFKDYAPDGFDPVAIGGQDVPPKDDPHRHVWWQRGQAKLEAKPSKRVRMYVPATLGHDDLLIADGLLCLAAQHVGQPQIVTSGQVDWYSSGRPPVAVDVYRSDAEIERLLQ